VFGKPPQEMRVKATKDLEQAAALIEYLSVFDADLLHHTWRDMVARGPGWRRRAEEGLKALQTRFPGLDTSSLA